ncbi:MAG: hypothetical protein ACREQQ_07220 [Candidatus Binatia bacterium]
MFVRMRARALWLGAVLAPVLIATSQASATPALLIDPSYLGGGVWQYDLTLDNSGGLEPLSGLNILDAYTIFGLDDTSTITAPSGWSYFAPLPPSVDELHYFSLSGASDVAEDTSLGGFSFESTTDPNTIDWNAVVADAIGGTSSSQTPLLVLPEPATALLFAAGLAVQAIHRKRALRRR